MIKCIIWYIYKPVSHLLLSSSMYYTYRGWQKQVYSCEYEKQFILVLSQIVIFHMNCKPTFAVTVCAILLYDYQHHHVIKCIVLQI